MNHQSFSRRTFLRGVGVSMALPWMESFRVWGDEAKAVRRRERGPGAPGRPVRGQRFPWQGMVGARAAAATWSWARCSPRWPTSASGCSSFAGFTTPRPRRATSTARRPATCFPAPRWPRAARSARERASTSSWRGPTASRPRCRAWCSPARSRTRRCTRTIRCSTARTSRGLRRRRRRRWSFTPRWPSIGCSETRRSAATRACSTPCCPTHATSAARSASADQRKLDEYLDSVREVEERIERAGQRGELQGWRPTLDQPNIPRPADGIPQDIGEHMRLMCDILVLGFQTDTTRICTLKLNNDHSSLRFPNLGVDYMIHHLLSHSDTADWLKVNQFFLEAGRLHRAEARRNPRRRSDGTG